MKDTTLTASVRIDSHSIESKAMSESIQITGMIVGGAIVIVLILSVFTTFFDKR